MVALRARLRELQGEQREVVTIVAGNGSGYGVTEARGAEFSSAAQELESCAAELTWLGVQIKDADIGLLDFPALRHGREVLLCWQVGEERVEWWHGLEEGYAGRKPIDWETDEPSDD
jgi:hypothetical protein